MIELNCGKYVIGIVIDFILYHCLEMGHKTDPLDFILDPGNSITRQKDLNKARKLAREVTDNREKVQKLLMVHLMQSKRHVESCLPITDKPLRIWIWKTAINHSLNCFGTHSYLALT